jgi:predicted helicase
LAAAAKYGFMMFPIAIKQGIANKKALLHKRDIQIF